MTKVLALLNDRRRAAAAALVIALLAMIMFSTGAVAPVEGAAGNESIATATDLGTWTNTPDNGTTRRNETLASPDTDKKNYYKFVLDEDKFVRIRVQKMEVSNVELAIVDVDNNTIFDGDGWGSTSNGHSRQMYWTVIGAGTWYIRVTQTSNTNNTFDLKWWVKDAPALVNDDYGAGVWTTGTVAIDGSTDGTIKSLNQSEGRDFDWFAVQIDDPGIYRFKVVAKAPITNDPSIILRKEFGKFIEYQSGPITYDTRRGRTGRHFLEIRGKNGDYTVSASRLSVSEPRSGDFPAHSSTFGYIKKNGGAGSNRQHQPWIRH